jgi:D-glycero-D-manno-heptose 1,7-bisphosphate phosphatase
MKSRAVFLDRDGVINRAVVRDGRPRPPSSLSQLEILPDVPNALVRLRSTGYRLIVVTNQPDVARGAQTREAVDAMHNFLKAQLPIDEVRACYHDDADHCLCRKPLPGMLLEAARAWELDLSRSFMVGDRWRDIEAGRCAGCATIFIDYHYAEEERSIPHHRVSTLGEAAQWILERTHESDH